MKYRDLVTTFVAILFFLSLGYGLGVDRSYWILPVIMFIVFVFTVYKLWIEK